MPKQENSTVAKIMVVSDIHYLSDKINDHGEAFQALITGSDGKFMNEVETLVDSLIQTVNEENPDVLIISGDLTFNGEKVSHEELADKLKEVKCDVLVIPGNHDLNNSSSAKFIDDHYERIASATADEFKAIYNQYGYCDAIYFDEYSNSYVYELQDTWILMLDTNSKANNRVSDETYIWLEEVLKTAKSKDKQVIGVSHQNLYAHSDVLYQGFQIDQDERLLKLYEKYEVKLNLSGHMHLQHIKGEHPVEIATSSMVVYPFHYGMVTLNKNEISYEAKELLADESLREKAYKWFISSGNSQMDWYFEGYSDEEKNLMMDCFRALNVSYFTGLPLEEDIQKGFELWKQHEPDFFTLYVISMEKEVKNNHTYYFQKN